MLVLLRGGACWGGGAGEGGRGALLLLLLLLPTTLRTRPNRALPAAAPPLRSLLSTAESRGGVAAGPGARGASPGRRGVRNSGKVMLWAVAVRKASA